MGFGSYDESEQKDQDVDADDDGGISVHESDHDGDVSFESGASTADLLADLRTMKGEDEAEE